MKKKILLAALGAVLFYGVGFLGATALATSCHPIVDSTKVSFTSKDAGRRYYASEVTINGRRYLLVETVGYGYFQIVPLE